MSLGANLLSIFVPSYFLTVTKYGIKWVMLQIGSCCNNHLIINAI